MTTDRTYLRWCLVVPPFIHLLVGMIPNRVDGFMAASLYYGGLPYVIWATVMFVQIGRRPVNRLRRMVVVAPLTYLAVFLVNFVVVGLMTTPVEEWSGVALEIVGGIVFLTPFVVLLGYIWVGLALLGWRFRRLRAGELVNQAE